MSKSVLLIAVVVFTLSFALPNAEAATISSDGGITLTLSFKYDYDANMDSWPSNTEWIVKDKLEYDFTETAKAICRLTEGKHYLKRVYLAEEAHAWDYADIRWTLSPEGETSANLGGWANPWGHVYYGMGIMDDAWKTVGHELGHYIYSLIDEYPNPLEPDYNRGYLIIDDEESDIFDVIIQPFPDAPTHGCEHTNMNNSDYGIKWCDGTDHLLTVEYVHPETSETVTQELSAAVLGTPDEGPYSTRIDMPYATPGWDVAPVFQADLIGHHTEGVFPELPECETADVEFVYLAQAEDVPGRILLLDRSGSMAYEVYGRPAVDYVQETALYLYHISNSDDYIGARVYNNVVEDLFEYGLYDDENTLVDFYDAENLTDIRLALEGAIDTLLIEHEDDEGGAAGAEIFLMSDGKQTVEGDLFEEVERAEAEGIVIHTFSFGDADTETMDAIADGSGGIVYSMFAPTEYPNNLKLGMVRAISDRAGLTSVLSYRGELTQSGATEEGVPYHEVTFIVPPDSRATNFSLFPESNAASIYKYEIKAPDGTTYLSDQTPVQTRGRFLGTRITSPEEGKYLVRVYSKRGGQLPTGEVQLLAYIDSREIDANSWLDGDYVDASRPREFPIYATVANRFPLTGAKVTAYFYTPDGRAITESTLYDDGLDGDAIAGDGLYTGIADTETFRKMKVTRAMQKTVVQVGRSSVPAPNHLWNDPAKYESVLKGYRRTTFTAISEQIVRFEYGNPKRHVPHLRSARNGKNRWFPGTRQRAGFSICNAAPNQRALRVNLGQGIDVRGVYGPMQNRRQKNCFDYSLSFYVVKNAAPGRRTLAVQYGDTILKRDRFGRVIRKPIRKPRR